ncbi:MAG: ABC transporter permease [Nitrospirota bacterium]|nr:ABC transporter permease [Nitrospirota bacterium]
MGTFKAIYIICLRELRKFFRDRLHLAGTLFRPILWLMVLGWGFGRIVATGGGISYKEYIFPGITGMTVLYASIFSSMSIIWDKEFGPLKEILVAPVSRSAIVFGKAASGTAVATLQAAIIALFVPILGIHITPGQFVAFLLTSALVSFTISSLGILITSHLKSLDSFNVVMNFLVMPMFFLSGAIYPIKVLPEWLKMVAMVNPLTYGVDALKNIMLTGDPSSPFSPDFPLWVDISVMVVIAASMTGLAAYSFRQKE